MKKLVISIVVLLVSVNVFAQSADSLVSCGVRFLDKGIFQKADSCFNLASEKIDGDTSYETAYSYHLHYGLLHVKTWDFNKAWPLLEQALALAKERNDKPRIVSALSGQATYHNLHGDLRKAIALQEEAKDFAVDGDSSNYYGLISNLGIGYANLGLSDVALDYYLKARNYFTREDEKNSLAHIENNLGELYRENFKEYGLAAEHLRAAAAINREEGHMPKLAMNYHNLAVTFQNEGLCDSAEHYINLCLELREKNGISGRMAASITVKGDIHICKQEYDLAIDAYERALEICREYNIPPGFYFANQGLSRAYFEMGDYRTSIDKASEALAAAKRMDSPVFISEVHLQLHQIYKANDELEKALFHLENGTQLKDSLGEARDRDVLNNMRAKYETELAKTRAEKAKLEEVAEEVQVDYQKLWNIGSVLTLILVLVILGLIWKAYSGKKLQLAEEKRLREKLEESNRKITSQSEELKKVDSLKTAIFSVLGHDLRAPLSSISSLVQLLGDKAISSKEFEEISEDLKERTNVSLKSLDVILQWSQLSSGRGTPEIEELAVEPIIDDILDLNKHQILKKGLIIDKQFDSTAKLPADPNQFNSIAMNLISNALKYSPDGEVLTIGTAETENEVEFFVKDRGKGIPSETIHLLQSEKESKIASKRGINGEKGTGIGLQIVKDFVKAHGAKLKISNLPKGAEVRVCFPKHSQLLEVV